jgi:hypothetical protein
MIRRIIESVIMKNAAYKAGAVNSGGRALSHAA